MMLTISADSDVGRVRRRNEDAYLVERSGDPGINLFAVADGMGGYSDGHVASLTVVDSIRSGFSSVDWRSFSGADELCRRVKTLVREANEALCETVKEGRLGERMGTTLTMALQRDRQLIVGHVGDSRGYLMRDDRLSPLTEDHSVVGELVQSGEIEESEAMRHPHRNLLTAALGLEADIAPDVFARDLRDGDVILLCTDGLTGLVHSKEIEERVRTAAADAFDGLASDLIQLANARGGTDNTTVVAIRISDGGEDGDR